MKNNKKINNKEIEKIGIDIGGSFIKAGVVVDNKVIKSIKIITPKKKKEIIQKLFFIVDNFLTKNTKFIGIGIPGTINSNGTTNKQKNIDLGNVNLKKLFEDKYKITTLVDNDANCFTLAEAVLGKCKEYKNVIGITLGTGFGTGLVINKRIYSGKGKAFEYGSTIIDINSLKTVEDFLGKKSIIQSSKEYNLIINEPKDLFELALKKDKNAIKFWKDYGSVLGLVISNLIKIIDPEIIVIGGKISESWDYFNKDMNKIIDKYSNKCLIIKNSIEHPGILGATLLSL